MAMAHTPTIPSDESARLQRLHALAVLDSAPEAVFDQITALAAQLCGTPIALISLVDADRQWFKSQVGWGGLPETHRDHAFCAHAIERDALMEVADATQDPRFSANPLVTGPPEVRFYAGAPITMPQGERIGTLCVLDCLPRQLTPLQRDALVRLSQMVGSALLEREQRLRLSGELAAAADNYRLIAEGQAALMSEMHAAHASKAESAQLLQHVLDSLPARISYWGADSRNRFANKTFLEWFGSTQSSVVGTHVRDVIGEAWFARIKPLIDAGLAGRPGQVEAASVRADGLSQVMDVRFAPDIRDAQVQGLLVFALDITERRAAEKQAAQHEKRFKLLVEGVRDYAIYMLDPQGRITTWNAGAERNKGYSAEEVLGQNFSMFFVPEDVEAGKPAQALAHAAQQGDFETEGWRRKRDGSRFWAGVLLTAIRDEQQQLIGFAKITRDLSEQRRQQNLLVRVAELAPCAMLLVDAHGRLTMVNAEAERVFGYQRHEMLGQALEMLLPAPLREAHVGMRRGFLAAPSARTMGDGRRLHARRKNGDEFPVEIGLSPIESSEGTNTLAAVFDITSRQLQQVATERALAEKEVMLKEIHHRVKNNLQVISSLLQLQAGYIEDEQARQVFEASQGRIRSMALVHEKLYQAADLAHIDFGEYLRDLLSGLGGSYGAKASAVRIDAHIEPVQLDVDRAIPAGLVVNELVSNAFKHGFPGHRTGCIQVGLRGGGTLPVEITVCDDGVGWPAGFDPSQSTSLGLRLVHILAKQLQGELQFDASSRGVRCALRLRPEGLQA